MPPDYPLAVVALLVVIALASAAWGASRILVSRLAPVLAVGSAVLLLAVPLVGVLWAAVAAWLLLAAAGLVALRLGRSRNWSRGIRNIIASGSLVAVALGYVSSWASIDTWWYGSVGAVAILVASRLVTGNPVIRAATLGLATVLALVAIGAEGFHINERFAAGAGAVIESVHAVAILAILLVAASALLARRLSSVETRTLFWISLVAAIGAGANSWFAGEFGFIMRSGDLVLPYAATTTLLALGLVVALVLWRAASSTATYGIERFAASLLVAPAAAWGLESLTRWASLPPLIGTIALMVAALLTAAAALAFAVVRSESRLALEIGAAAVAVYAVLFSLGMDATWLVLIVAAVTVLMLAISPDGLFASTSPRKHLGWLALALAIGGLWWALQDAAITDVEPYVLPPAGAILLVALLGWRGTRRSSEASPALPLIALSGLLVAIVPIAVVAMNGPTARTVAIVASCAALLLAASIATRPASLRPYLDVAAIAGAAGLVIAGFGRASVIALTPVKDDLQLDVWVASTVAVLVAAAILQARISDTTTGRRRIEASESVIALAIGGIVAIEFSVLDVEVIGTVRAVTVLILLSATYMVCQLIDRAPFPRIIGWVALGGAAIVGITAVNVKAVRGLDPLEWATAIVAAALLTVGAVQMRRQPTAGSWTWLAPGILVLILPSLVATFTDAPIWRLVGLGVVCIAAILVGALLKLQAPLILGAVAVLVHAIRTFAPQIIEIYQLTEWWIWAVVGGAIILFVAITLEKRVRDLKSFGSRVSALR